MRIDVVGAGMSGLLAAGMLRQDCNGVYEAEQALPNNHSAVLRFRSSAVADALSIPFKQAWAIKSVEPWRNPIADAMVYSIKTNGTATLRSVLTADSAPQPRFIAPKKLIDEMRARVSVPIQFGQEYKGWMVKERPIISTIPMPFLMDALNYRRPERFRHNSGINIVVELRDVDAYCSLYVPDPAFPAARISITGNQMVAECYSSIMPEEVDLLALKCASKMGLGSSHIIEAVAKKQVYAKALPIDEQERKKFIMWASESWGIYSLGRFATWRPGLLLDDVVNDVRVIQRLINQPGESYTHKLKG